MAVWGMVGMLVVLVLALLFVELFEVVGVNGTVAGIEFVPGRWSVGGGQGTTAAATVLARVQRSKVVLGMKHGGGALPLAQRHQRTRRNVGQVNDAVVAQQLRHCLVHDHFHFRRGCPCCIDLLVPLCRCVWVVFLVLVVVVVVSRVCHQS